jgi:hypothetical protein
MKHRDNLLPYAEKQEMEIISLQKVTHHLRKYGTLEFEEQIL